MPKPWDSLPPDMLKQFKDMVEMVRTEIDTFQRPAKDQARQEMARHLARAVMCIRVANKDVTAPAFILDRNLITIMTLAIATKEKPDEDDGIGENSWTGRKR